MDTIGDFMRARRLYTWLAFACSYLIFLPVPSDAVLSAMKNNDHQHPNAPAGVDLDVTYISRSPLYYAYCVEYSWDVPGQPGLPYLCPGTENHQRWPAAGETVTFTAHIVNKGSSASPPVDYAWYLDGVQVDSGSLPGLAPAAEITVQLDYAWPHTLSQDGQRALGQHSIAFAVDTAGLVDEAYESNNRLEDPTNAMSFSKYFTPDMYAAYNLPVDESFPHSAEDWIQKQIAAMNENFANSIYPTTPDGSSLRVRINKIEVHASDPGGDGQHDGGWFISGDYRHGASAYYDPYTDIDWGMVHELSHQVSLIDLYAIGAAAPATWVTDRLGNPVNFSFTWKNAGLMGGGDIAPHSDHHLYSSHSAGGASTYYGYRNGYYGSHQYDIPLQNYLLVLDNQGNPAAEVQVNLYQRTGPDDWSGMMGIDGTPDISGVTGSDGLFQLPNRSANGGATTQNGHRLHDNPFGVVDIIGNQNLFLGQLVKGEHEEFFWLDITAFNLAYWDGDTDSHTFTLNSHVPVAGAPASPQITSTRVEGAQVHLCWQASPTPGVGGYRVYRAVPPDYHYLPAGEPFSSLCFSEAMPVPWAYDGHVYAVVAVDGLGRESGFSNFIWAKDLSYPAAVVVDPGGIRTVLDPRNGYALLRQDRRGRYIQNLSSVHYHLENTYFMNLDADGNLLFSHPGDWYENRHSVRVADSHGIPLLEFGQQGSAPGEFETPTGVAAWGPPCRVEQPYLDDAHTLLLLHFDGSYSGTQGESGAYSGTSFSTGRFDQGVLIEGTDTLSYPRAGNLDHTQGGLEFWFKPNWDGNDGQGRGFIEVGEEWQWNNRMRIQKDSADNLRFILMDNSGQEHGLAYNISHWKSGEWHHIAVTWQVSKIVMYVDGLEVARDENIQLPDSLGDNIHIGSLTVLEPFRAEGVFDELRISDIPRAGNSQTCNRILVADSNNQRVQAFDSQGDYLASFGTLGSDAGQFNNPQGIAVDQLGRVVVVDQGNNRLVWLNFDGEAFTYLGSTTAGFNLPTGVAVGPEGNIYVADTGNNRVVELDPAGQLIMVYMQSNDGYTGTFYTPRGVAIDSNGNIIVADSGNRRVVTIYRSKPVYLPQVHR